MNIYLLRAEMILIIGVISTIFMDLFSILLYYTANIPVEWNDVGLLSINVLQSLHLFPDSFPAYYTYVIGWITHYVTGIIYAGLYFEIFHRLLKKPIFSIHVFYFTLLLTIIPFCVIAPLEGYSVFYIGADDIGKKLSYALLLHLFYSFGLILTTYLVHKLNIKRHLNL